MEKFKLTIENNNYSIYILNDKITIDFKDCFVEYKLTKDRNNIYKEVETKTLKSDLLINIKDFIEFNLIINNYKTLEELTFKIIKELKEIIEDNHKGETHER